MPGKYIAKIKRGWQKLFISMHTAATTTSLTAGGVLSLETWPKGREVKKVKTKICVDKDMPPHILS